MTRIAVFSDTHGDLSRLDAAIRRMEPVDAFLHLGDFGSDARRIAETLRLPYHAVRGNCDAASDFPRERIVRYENAALYLTHGDRYPDIYSLAYRAEEKHCAAVLFGHTHEPLMRASGPILIVNPGSLSRPRFGYRPSCCVLSIEGGSVRVEMCSL